MKKAWAFGMESDADGEHPSFFALRKTEEGRVLDKLRCK
jgi:hypothetical protein